jgi:hypothetical protein
MKKGDIIFYINKRRGGVYSEIRETTVTKVGREYFETSLNSKSVKLTIHVSNGSWIDGDTSDDHNRYFESIEQHAEWLEKIQLRKKITDFVKESLYVSDIQKLRKIAEQI